MQCRILRLQTRFLTLKHRQRVPLADYIQHKARAPPQLTPTALTDTRSTLRRHSAISSTIRGGHRMRPIVRARAALARLTAVTLGRGGAASCAPVGHRLVAALLVALEHADALRERPLLAPCRRAERRRRRHGGDASIADISRQERRVRAARSTRFPCATHGVTSSNAYGKDVQAEPVAREDAGLDEGYEVHGKRARHERRACLHLRQEYPHAAVLTHLCLRICRTRCS